MKRRESFPAQSTYKCALILNGLLALPSSLTHQINHPVFVSAIKTSAKIKVWLQRDKGVCVFHITLPCLGWAEPILGFVGAGKAAGGGKSQLIGDGLYGGRAVRFEQQSLGKDQTLLADIVLHPPQRRADPKQRCPRDPHMLGHQGRV